MDLTIVKTVLLLTGAFHGTKNLVAQFLRRFQKFDWLWKDDMEAAYRSFIESHPTIDVRPAAHPRYFFPFVGLFCSHTLCALLSGL